VSSLSAGALLSAQPWECRLSEVSLDPFPDGLPLDADAVLALVAKTVGGYVGQMVELAKLLGADEGEEFAAGLRSLMHESIDRVIRPEASDEDAAAAIQSLFTFLESWIMSGRLDGSTEWHRQMQASDDALRRNDLGEPLTAAEL